MSRTRRLLPAAGLPVAILTLAFWSLLPEPAPVLPAWVAVALLCSAASNMTARFFSVSPMYLETIRLRSTL